MVAFRTSWPSVEAPPQPSHDCRESLSLALLPDLVPLGIGAVGDRPAVPHPGLGEPGRADVRCRVLEGVGALAAAIAGAAGPLGGGLGGVVLEGAGDVRGEADALVPAVLQVLLVGVPSP